MPLGALRIEISADTRAAQVELYKIAAESRGPRRHAGGDL